MQGQPRGSRYKKSGGLLRPRSRHFAPCEGMSPGAKRLAASRRVSGCQEKAYSIESVMVLWIAMAALAVAVSLPLLLALRRAAGGTAERAAADIYRDQLGELERDAERGLIG